MEKSMTIVSDKKNVMRNSDVASFYPRIIINSELFPPQLGETFIRVYEDIVKSRLDDKKQASKLKFKLKELLHELSQAK